MRHLKLIKKYPFLFMLVISTVILTFIGFVGKNNIYSNYTIGLLRTPQLAAVFEGAGEGKYPWMIRSSSVKDEASAMVKQVGEKDPSKDLNKEAYPSDDSDDQGTIGKVASDKASSINEDGNSMKVSISKAGSETDIKADIKEDIKADSKAASDKEVANKTDNITSENNVGDLQSKDNMAFDDKNSNTDNKVLNKSDDINPTDIQTDVASVQTDNTEKNADSKDNTKAHDLTKSSVDDTKKNADKGEDNENATTEVCDFQTVDEDYFDDALFIGDSRTVGLSEYSGWTNPTYYADVGMTIYDIFNRKIADIEGRKTTILEALNENQFKKIYIMVGINELGRGTTETFIDEYKKVLKQVEDVQPDAIIFAEGIMKVSKEKSDTDPIFNNENIEEKNEHIAKLANNKNIFYIDVNEAITDETGGIPSKYTFDNVHLKAAYYKMWTAFLLNHGIIAK